jgi:predicted GNAT family acetyltransferase
VGSFCIFAELICKVGYNSLEVKKMEIKKEKKRFVLIDGNKEIGEITYFFDQKNNLVVDHTGINPAYRGQGLAQKLVEAVLKMAEEEKLKIIPICPYVLAYFQSHPEHIALWNQDPHDYEVACKL